MTDTRNGSETDLDWSLTILTLAEMINGTDEEFHCGDLPDLEKMKVIAEGFKN